MASVYGSKRAEKAEQDFWRKKGVQRKSHLTPQEHREHPDLVRTFAFRGEILPKGGSRD